MSHSNLFSLPYPPKEKILLSKPRWGIPQKVKLKHMHNELINNQKRGKQQ